MDAVSKYLQGKDPGLVVEKLIGLYAPESPFGYLANQHGEDHDRLLYLANQSREQMKAGGLRLAIVQADTVAAQAEAIANRLKQIRDLQDELFRRVSEYCNTARDVDGLLGHLTDLIRYHIGNYRGNQNAVTKEVVRDRLERVRANT